MQKPRFLTFFAIFSIISLYDAKALTIASTESVTNIKNALAEDISKVQESVNEHATTLSKINTNVEKLASKQSQLSNDNVKTTGSDGFVSSVTASNGSISITKTELSIPVGSYDKPTARAQIWIQ